LIRGDKVKEKNFLILPGCDDSNRGDQALIWETVELARTAGHIGKYYMLADKNNSIQSQKKDIDNVKPILPHPSEHFNDNANTQYSLLLKLKWAIVAIIDLLVAEPLVHPKLRNIFLPFYSSKIKNQLAFFQNASAAFVKGGGFLHSYGEITDIYKIYFFLYHIRLALSYDIKVYVLPNSFGPFEAPFVSEMIKSVLHKCECVMTREGISKEILNKECGIQAHKYQDIAFYLKKDLSFDVENYLIKHDIPINVKKCVGITMRPYRFEGMSDGKMRYQQYIKALAECTIWLSNNGYFPILIEHVHSTLEHENDLSCVEKVVEEIGDNCEYRVFSDHTLDCEQLKSVYGCLSYLIGTRFHSVIFSLAQSVPCIAITYGGNKGIGIMQDMGLEKYSVSISDVSAEVLIRKFEMLVDEKDEIVEKINYKLIDAEREKLEIIELLRR